MSRRVIHVGAIETPTGYANEGDLLAYRDTLDGVVESLKKDIHDQFVWMDPDSVPDWLAEIGEESGSTSVAELRARQKAKGEAQSKAEIAFGERWFSFYQDWQKRKKEVTPTAFGVPLITLSQWWDSLRDDHTKLRAHYAKFKSLGGDPRSSSDPGEVPDKVIKMPTWTTPAAITWKALKDLLPWWAWTGLAVVGAGVIYVYLHPLLALIPLPARVMVKAP